MSTSLNVVSIAIVCWASTSRRATVRRNMLIGTTLFRSTGASFGSDCACGAASVRAATGLASGAGAASPAGASGVLGSVTGVSEGCSSGGAGWVVASSGLVDGCFFAGEPTILYIDLQLIHEVTSPQAFDGLRLANRKLRRSDRHIATVDHNVPTTSAQDRLVITDQISAAQVNALRKNCAEFGIEFFDVQDRDQGIVHMIGPELGATKPGSTIVCGDSHTSTHGAFGALAFGIGTSEVEHVMATQTLPQSKPTTFRITVDGDLPLGVTGVGRGSWR